MGREESGRGQHGDLVNCPAAGSGYRHTAAEGTKACNSLAVVKLRNNHLLLVGVVLAVDAAVGRKEVHLAESVGKAGSDADDKGR